VRIAACPVLVVAAVALSTWIASAHDPTTKVTYSREIVRLLNQRCVGCHRPDGSAPMAFTTYAEARPWAHAMKEMVLDRRMPPWPAAPGFDDFDNDPTLTPFEAGLLATWADGGAPKGDDRDLPARDERLVGQADVTMTLPVWPSRSGRVRVDLAYAGTADAWIVRWELRVPGRVEHADVAIAANARETGEAREFDRLGVWVPPGGVQSLPGGAGQRLPAAATIRIAADLRDGDATAAADGGALWLWVARSPRAPVVHRLLRCGTTRLDRGATAFAIWPHVEAGGVAASARTPTGRILPLIVVRQFDPRYQPMYRFRRPIALPRGTLIDVQGAPAQCEVDLALVSDSPRR